MRPGGGGGVSVGRSGGREIDDVFFCVFCEPSPRVEHEKDRTDDDNDDDDDAGTQLENVVRARQGFRGVDVDVGVFEVARQMFQTSNRLEPRSSSPPARYSLPWSFP